MTNDHKRMAQIYSVATQNVKSWEPKCQQGWLLLEALREDLLSQASLLAPGEAVLLGISRLVPASLTLSSRALLPGLRVHSSSCKDPSRWI